VSDPLINRRLGRYQIEAEIGRGGMARVYRAVDTILQRQVALKVLSPQLGDDAALAQRFEREAITAANLRHPAIITIFDVGEAEGIKYIAMEYIAGRTLQDVLVERKRLSLPQTIGVLRPVAEALDYAHGRGAIHRDIKPHNILIERDGRVLLTDFGIAISLADNGQRLTRPVASWARLNMCRPNWPRASASPARATCIHLASSPSRRWPDVCLSKARPHN